MHLRWNGRWQRTDIARLQAREDVCPSGRAECVRRARCASAHGWSERTRSMFRVSITKSAFPARAERPNRLSLETTRCCPANARYRLRSSSSPEGTPSSARQRLGRFARIITIPLVRYIILSLRASRPRAAAWILTALLCSASPSSCSWDTLAPILMSKASVQKKLE
jgi:hypothetical protein